MMKNSNTIEAEARKAQMEKQNREFTETLRQITNKIMSYFLSNNRVILQQMDNMIICYHGSLDPQ